ncbi:(p)ppGpp synthetase [Orientia tsutsugamushi]|nr:spoT-like ppGpp hydrolase domain protein [Orientia tsutsugamushi str. TA763]SPP23809.1 (p)ppGpp synthetase [Orientia tsutsugamushi]KJV72532.1 putative spoT-like ppGpp hydrolase [Orientia tsutsugamushi str. TA763]KJV73258.1 putative spoT-like ppGpp hydrolase [Orientia tsutsugamushi str. TA763]KJV75206.1 putative guanosine polyphosphate pyrophosphohydrolase/synthetase [Orientia tsutsugamushi str. TA763]
MLAFLNCEHINKLLDKLDLINHSFDKRINLDKVEKAIFYVKKISWQSKARYRRTLLYASIRSSAHGCRLQL